VVEMATYAVTSLCLEPLVDFATQRVVALLLATS
jgi:hypothetical protein